MTCAGFKHGAILYNEAEVFSLPITNPNGRPMLPFDWLIYLGLILARCHKILESDGYNFLFYFTSKSAFWTKWMIASGEDLTKKIDFFFISNSTFYFFLHFRKPNVCIWAFHSNL